jgi:osmotically-inducible protein OsmY
MRNERRYDPATPRPDYSRPGTYESSRAYRPGGYRGENSYREFGLHWGVGDEGEQYFGTGSHYGGGFGTAPSSRASSAGTAGAPGYARKGAWTDPTDWSLEDERDLARDRGEAPVSYRGRGPRGYTRSDERLLETVCEQLTDDPRIDASGIEVEVQQQVVTLRGSVPDRRTKYAVEELVENAGARDIENQLRVNASQDKL